MKSIKLDQYSHYYNGIKPEINTIKTNINYNLFIVYFINCLTNPNYPDFITNQIGQIAHLMSTIYIIATISTNNEDLLRNMIKKIFPKLNIKIEVNYVNQFEYLGILKVWQLGQIHIDPCGHRLELPDGRRGPRRRWGRGSVLGCSRSRFAAAI